MLHGFHLYASGRHPWKVGGSGRFSLGDLSGSLGRGAAIGGLERFWLPAHGLTADEYVTGRKQFFLFPAPPSWRTDPVPNLNATRPHNTGPASAGTSLSRHVWELQKRKCPREAGNKGGGLKAKTPHEGGVGRIENLSRSRVYRLILGAPFL